MKGNILYAVFKHDNYTDTAAVDAGKVEKELRDASDEMNWDLAFETKFEIQRIGRYEKGNS